MSHKGARANVARNSTAVVNKSKIVPPINGFSTDFNLPSNEIKLPNKLTPKSKVASPMDRLKIKKAWDLAFAGAKSIPMNAIMMYMSGNTIALFSIMIVFMLFFQPIQAILAVNQTFQKLELVEDGEIGKHKVDLTIQKLCYLGIHITVMCMGLYKCNQMGLLPTSQSDWLAFYDHPKIMEQVLF